MLPAIPTPVWEQIAVVIVFALLLSGMGWIIVRIFTQAIADVNRHYAALLVETNKQWQAYFDARSESSNLLAEQLTQRMDQIAKILSGLVSDFKTHDLLERQALDELNTRRGRGKGTG